MAAARPRQRPRPAVRGGAAAAVRRAQVAFQAFARAVVVDYTPRRARLAVGVLRAHRPYARLRVVTDTAAAHVDRSLALALGVVVLARGAVEVVGARAAGAGAGGVVAGGGRATAAAHEAGVAFGGAVAGAPPEPSQAPRAASRAAPWTGAIPASSATRAAPPRPGPASRARSTRTQRNRGSVALAPPARRGPSPARGQPTPTTVHEYKLLATTAALERGYCTGKDLEGAGSRSREVDFKPIHTEEGCRAYFDSLASTAEKSYTYTRGQQQAPDSGVLGRGAA